MLEVLGSEGKKDRLINVIGLADSLKMFVFCCFIGSCDDTKISLSSLERPNQEKVQTVV